VTTLFDTTTPPAAAPVAAGPRPLVVGLDIALITSGVAGPGWADHFRTGDRRGEQRLTHIVETAATFYRNADFVLIEGAAYSMAKQVGHDEMSAAAVSPSPSSPPTRAPSTPRAEPVGRTRRGGSSPRSRSRARFGTRRPSATSRTSVVRPATTRPTPTY
jgi:hypothetical protein